MNTTNLFVELIVIGVGALIWVGLLIFSVFGFTWIPSSIIFSMTFAVPLLAFTYVLGIMTDRIADSLFQWIWKNDFLGQYFENRSGYYEARRKILTNSEKLSELLEYGRSRLRICRGWCFNTAIIWILSHVFFWTQLKHIDLFWTLYLFCDVFLIVFTYGLWFAWKKLTMNEYRKIKEQSAYLEKE